MVAKGESADELDRLQVALAQKEITQRHYHDAVLAQIQAGGMLYCDADQQVELTNKLEEVPY